MIVPLLSVGKDIQLNLGRQRTAAIKKTKRPQPVRVLWASERLACRATSPSARFNWQTFGVQRLCPGEAYYETGGQGVGLAMATANRIWSFATILTHDNVLT
jgi:hypothetical protein